MAKIDIRGLNYITSSGKQNTFNIDIAYTNDGHIQSIRQVTPPDFDEVKTRTFFGDIGEEESMSQKYNTNVESLYDINNGIIIHNLYDLTKVKLKSGVSQHATQKKVDIFVPTISDDFLDVCQFESFAYGLTKKTTDSMTILSTCMNYRSSSDYSYHYKYAKDGNIATHLYPIVQRDLTSDMLSNGVPIDKIPEISTYNLYVLSGGQDPNLSSQRVENVFNIVRNIQNIEYNYLVEFPENIEYNQYENGFIQCNSFITKNDLTYQYKMDLSSFSNRNNLSIGLYNARDYVGLGVCGGKMFMKYRDNMSYPVSADKYVGKDSGVLQHNFLSSIRSDYSFQHIEVVNSLNRFSTSSTGHKSSMYSISLNDTGLNSSGIAETTKAKLRQNITNSIRVIAEKICPANTQLFQVYFKGK